MVFCFLEFFIDLSLSHFLFFWIISYMQNTCEGFESLKSYIFKNEKKK